MMDELDASLRNVNEEIGQLKLSLSLSLNLLHSMDLLPGRR